MPKGIQANDMNAASTAQGQSTAAYNAVNPVYQQWLTNPQGFTPQQKADMLTASGQSLGGSTAGAVGQGALASARTNNVGGYQMGVDEAARQGGVEASANTLGVQNQSDLLARQQQMAGAAGENSIYNGANSTGLGYSTQALDAANSNPWQKILLQSMASAGQAAGGGAFGTLG